MGGKIWVESDAGKGATFHFTIQVRAAAANAAPAWQAPQPQLTGKRVLVIEDNATNRGIISQRGAAVGHDRGNRREPRRMPWRSSAQGHPSTPSSSICNCPTRTAWPWPTRSASMPPGAICPILLLSVRAPRQRGHAPACLRASRISIHKPIRPAQLLDALCRALSVQVQREKKAPAAPILDADLARRLPLRLLLADDNPINQKVGLSVLHKLGYRADLATNGLEVLKALEQKPTTSCSWTCKCRKWTAWKRPGRFARRWPADKRPRIIAMTGNALVGDREQCLQAGMDDYISKPVRVEELQSALERWGPMKTRKPDTAFLTRQRAAPAENLLDQAAIAELRRLPPSGQRRTCCRKSSTCSSKTRRSAWPRSASPSTMRRCWLSMPMPSRA